MPTYKIFTECTEKILLKKYCPIQVKNDDSEI